MPLNIPLLIRNAKCGITVSQQSPLIPYQVISTRHECIRKGRTLCFALTSFMKNRCIQFALPILLTFIQERTFTPSAPAIADATAMITFNIMLHDVDLLILWLLLNLGYNPSHSARSYRYRHPAYTLRIGPGYYHLLLRTEKSLLFVLNPLCKI